MHRHVIPQRRLGYHNELTKITYQLFRSGQRGERTLKIFNEEAGDLSRTHRETEKMTWAEGFEQEEDRGKQTPIISQV